MIRPTGLFITALLATIAVSDSWRSELSAAQSADPKGPGRQPPSADKAAGVEAKPREFEQAGVCGRCHIVSVLEWGVSGHRDTETTCQKCHGPSREHVADERNNVKPDKLHRGEAIVKELCSACHEDGCPETLQVQTCQKCHHVHALVNPSATPAPNDEQVDKAAALWEQFGRQMAEGERRVERQEWKAAQAAFRAALKLIPNQNQAQSRLEMCSRRLHPAAPGFQIVGDQFDRQTGLPREVSVIGLGSRMLLVPPGEFDMGADQLPDSRPVHTVRINAFYLGRCEVTQSEWRDVMGDNPSAHQGEKFPNAGRLPVECVSWNDCQEFLRRLNQRVAGGGFRLPTEAEWEYACRGGADRQVVEELSERAWDRAKSLQGSASSAPFLQVDAYAPQPVGQLRPNAWKLHDMRGNVWEWCSSLWRPYLYDAEDGRESLEQTGLRILRGGGFADSAELLDPALRHAERPHRRFRWNGLRIARSIPAPTDPPPP